MTLLLQIQVNLISLFVLGILILYSHNKLNRIEKINRFFFTLIILTYFILLIEILSILFQHYSIKLLFIHKLINILELFLYPIVSYLLYKFIIEWTDPEYKLSNFIQKFLYVPVIINSLVCIINFKFNLIFYIDPNMLSYKRGPVYLLPFICNEIYLCCIFLYLIKNKYNIVRSEIIIFIKGFCITITFLTILQIIFPNYLIVWTFVAIFLTLSYLFMQLQLNEKDPLTGAFNNNFFYTYLNRLNKNRESNSDFAAINIDIDELEVINNTFGHATGDEVLRTFAKLLKKSFGKKGTIIRTGGAEFLVLINSTTKYELDTLLFNMDKIMYLHNKRSNKPYKIKFSYAYALYDNKFNTFDDFFNYIDKKMYKNKSL